MSDRAVFTKSSAERIARVVRRVEAGDRNTGALPTAPRFSGAAAGKIFRMATFTGAWAIDTQRTVTFLNQTNTPNTASALNLLVDYPDADGTQDCGVAKEGTQWYLISWMVHTQTAVFISSTANTTLLRDISLSAEIDTNTCAITIGQTNDTVSIVIVTGTYTDTFVKLGPAPTVT